jgi:mandelamide amidase
VGDVTGKSVGELRALLKAGEISSVGLVTQFLDKAEQNKNLNAFIHVDRERVLEIAASADAAGAAASKDQPLLGIPIVVKDNIHVAGMPNTAGTPALKGFVPEASNAVVARLQAAGAIVLAKTNMHELAFGITSNNAAFGAVGNPYDVTLFAGGSSGGTASAISAGLAPAGLGTDTGGSIRIPAALTGIVGFRPSSGRYVSTAVTPISSTRDTVGLLASNVADVILLDSVVSGSTMLPDAVAADELRIGVPRAWFFDNIDSETLPVIENALQKLSDGGVSLIDADVENISDLIARTSFPIALYEVVRELPAYLDEYGTGVTYEQLVEQIASPDVRGVFGTLGNGGPIDDDTYAAALLARDSMKETFAAYFAAHNLDAIFFPMTLLPARPIAGSDETVELNGERVPTFPTYIHNTDHATIAGLPSISLPAGLTASGLPIGLAIEGPAGSDSRLLSIALAIESILSFESK